MKNEHESQKSTPPKLVIRNARIDDVDNIVELTRLVYGNMPAYSRAQIIGQINAFPFGQFVAEFENAIVGYCATFRIDEKIALSKHTWGEITGGGYASRHSADGDFLYGMEVCVNKKCRGLRIGQRFYEERKRLCYDLRLKGIVFGGRIPLFGKHAAKGMTFSEYAEGVRKKLIRDPVLSFQLRNGFELLGHLPNYLPSDFESNGSAAHLVWRNPKLPNKTYPSQQSGHLRDSVRLATIQYMQRRVKSFEDFKKYVEYFVDVVSDYKADFALFPELFTLQLLSIEEGPRTPEKMIEQLAMYTEDFKNLMRELSIRYNVNLIGGSHPTLLPSGEIQNVSYVFLRDGSIHQQAKIHPTPNERYWWNIQGGQTVNCIMTDCGPIGILICYDSEFPELARHLVDQGALILFVPFCTDERQSYMRVRYCAQARAVENQCFVVMAGNVGNLPGVKHMDIQYAQSCILAPCDFQFARDGIAADTTPNVEMVGIADVRLDSLMAARNNGTVQNLKDRRFDLYSVKWNSVDS